ncbi:histidine--tRNA ligase [Methanobrevibacter arboriphilus]|uniref:histidine--tRNA ligase n=1 Tax=Methanobrevibacter arboriphilus TaxID=39441 RepID=UPI0006D1F6CB|nr:histidine--tRNA ligase [Methanobrevibacter arboriphilus]
MEFTRPRGTRDFLFDEMRERKKCENTLRKVFETYAYQEIKTPLFEDLKLFTTKSGEQIVDQLYNFTDKSDREITLRPEITAPVARLYINELQKTAKPIKLYYFGSCFRYERPQKGRFRQFWQFGCELIGAKSPEGGEAEAIAMAEQSLEDLGINTAEIHINHLGIIRGLFEHFKIDNEIQEQVMILIDKGDKELFEKELLEKDLVEDSKLNVMLKDILIKLIDFVGNEDVLNDVEDLLNDYEETKDSINEFKELINLLKSFNVSNYTLNLGIARGLDYYNGIVFEIYIPELGAQKQVAGGGSYNLVELFGGEQVESTGFAFGFDRLMNAIEHNSKDKNKNDIKNSNKDGFEEKSIVDVFVVPISNEQREKSFEIGQKLRNSGISTEIDLSRKKFKKLLNAANKLNAKYVILVGKNDLEKDSVTIKDMGSRNQELVAIDNIKEFLNNNKIFD